MVTHKFITLSDLCDNMPKEYEVMFYDLIHIFTQPESGKLLFLKHPSVIGRDKDMIKWLGEEVKANFETWFEEMVDRFGENGMIYVFVDRRMQPSCREVGYGCPPYENGVFIPSKATPFQELPNEYGNRAMM